MAELIYGGTGVLVYDRRITRVLYAVRIRNG